MNECSAEMRLLRSKSTLMTALAQVHSDMSGGALLTPSTSGRRRFARVIGEGGIAIYITLIVRYVAIVLKIVASISTRAAPT